jgi:membrane-associated phospholipid phosphatase
VSSLKEHVKGTVVGLSCLIGFMIVTALVASGLTQNADLGVALFVNQHNFGSLGTDLMILLTNYGREVVWGLLVVVMFLFGGRRTKLLAVELAVLFVVGIVIGDFAKLLVDRSRPEIAQGIILRVPAETDPSYPSGHALIVSIGAAFCLAKFRNKTLATLLAVEAALVAYSRIYVGVHYPLDVVGGVLLGISIALIGGAVVERYLGSALGKLLEPILLVLKEGPLDL